MLHQLNLSWLNICTIVVMNKLIYVLHFTW